MLWRQLSLLDVTDVLGFVHLQYAGSDCVTTLVELEFGFELRNFGVGHLFMILFIDGVLVFDQLFLCHEPWHGQDVAVLVDRVPACALEETWFDPTAHAREKRDDSRAELRGFASPYRIFSF